MQVPPCITALASLTYLDLSWNQLHSLKPGPYLKRLVVRRRAAPAAERGGTQCPAPSRVARVPRLTLPQGSNPFRPFLPLPLPLPRPSTCGPTRLRTFRSSSGLRGTLPKSYSWCVGAGVRGVVCGLVREGQGRARAGARALVLAPARVACNLCVVTACR
jgi:hypothetical protein